MTIFYQQGDLLFFNEGVPSGLQEIKSGVILHSDTTGHSHKVHGGVLLSDENKVLFISTSEMAVVTHEEHKDLHLPAGNYKVRIVREFDHLMEEARNVID